MEIRALMFSLFCRYFKNFQNGHSYGNVAETS